MRRWLNIGCCLLLCFGSKIHAVDVDRMIDQAQQDSQHLVTALIAGSAQLRTLPRQQAVDWLTDWRRLVSDYFWS